MPIAEFARLYYAMNKVLEDACATASLSKRAALVLLILRDAENGRMETSELVRRFQSWNVSSAHSAAKDVSIAKRELFEHDLVAARGGIRNIELTEKGRWGADAVIDAIEETVQTLASSEGATSMLRQMVETIPMKKPVASDRGETRGKGRKAADG